MTSRPSFFNPRTYSVYCALDRQPGGSAGCGEIARHHVVAADEQSAIDQVREEMTASRLASLIPGATGQVFFAARLVTKTEVGGQKGDDFSVLKCHDIEPTTVTTAGPLRMDRNPCNAGGLQTEREAS